ncbi:NAD(P)/FAD-dependent oxidoreductase [Actinokineospora sp. UTMC 2448]|uniref:FAD-dependent oxidoreductase n=1 Tax=Actinokineospora sp. UTMC 2448 TaxID=2268449 RepID=UPI002164DEEB|nr:FAD-dependent monooxygenase [Actinokineospora sp. UTMC 2448]UVS81498.1 Putative epoxidase LasC [Actinokineospora sp. UTMC 2448]
MGHDVGRRAIVLGGSMAGLLAARVLAESFAEVLVVDRDELTDVTTARRGVPQGRHVHGLLARGQQILEELFPSFTAGVMAAGVPTGDLGELRWFFNGLPLKPSTTGLVCLSATRPVLESHVRARVAALPNVTLVEKTDIVGLTTTTDNARVTGARVQPHDGGPEEVLEADLVVDATGRGSRTPAWLEELGYGRPDEDRVKVNICYTTRTYRLSDESVLRGDLSINPVASPATRRGGFFSRIEDGKCVLSLYGVLGDSAPTDNEGFVEFARSLPVPDIYDVIKDAEPLTDAVIHRYPASVRRRYERMTRFPDGMIVIGDAACSFNPVYGQGMTIAALEALTLRDHLRRGVPSAAGFHRDIAKVIDGAWDMSVSGDLGYPEVEGERTLKVRMGNAFMAKVQAAMTRDSAVTGAFMRVAGMVESPASLMRPGMLLRILRNGKPAAAPADQRPTDGPGDVQLPRAA